MRAAVVLLVFGLFAAGSASATLIERQLTVQLGSVGPSSNFPNFEVLGGVGTFFSDNPFTFDIGDVLVFDILFADGQRIFVEDPSGVSNESFSFALNTFPGAPGFSGTWTSTLEALDASPGIWAGPVTRFFQGGGGGFGWGAFVDVTSKVVLAAFVGPRN